MQHVREHGSIPHYANKWQWQGSLPKGNHKWCHQYSRNKTILQLNNKKSFHNTSCFSLDKFTQIKRFFTTQLFLFKQIYTKIFFTTQFFLIKKMTMSRFTLNKESSMVPLTTHHHPIFHFYDLSHPNHRGNCSIPCSFDITRCISLVVPHRTVDVRVMLDRPGTT